MEKENYKESVKRRKALRDLNAEALFDETKKDLIKLCDRLLLDQYTLRPPAQSGVRFKIWCPKDFYLTYIWSVGERESTLIKGQFWWVHKIYNMDENIPILSPGWFYYQDKTHKDSNGYFHTIAANIFHKEEARNRRRHCALYFNPDTGALRMSFSDAEFMAAAMNPLTHQQDGASDQAPQQVNEQSSLL
jgi:hypothetical protein